MDLFDMMGLTNGNPGAMQFILQAQKLFGNAPVLNKALDFAKTKDIKGTDLYVVWSDLCDKRTDVAVYTLALASDGIIDADVLKDGSSHEDYRIKGMIDLDVVEKFMDEEVSHGEE